MLSEYYQYDRLDRLVQRLIPGDTSDDRYDQLDMWLYDALGNMQATASAAQVLGGDANLDGQVSFADYNTVDSGLGAQYASWLLGDLNFDGSTTGADYNAIDASLGQTGGGALTAASRTHNAQNQLTAIDSSSLSYDANGNLMADNLSQSYAYDAWNRLVTAGTASYGYDALGRRIAVSYSSPSTDPAVDFYYSDQWQVLEERESGASMAKRQYVWSAVYVDALVLHDQDSGTDGTLDQRLYVAQDANFNVTALMDPTTGAVQERFSYDPFGEVTYLNADWTTKTTQQSGYGWVYLFQGKRYDANANLYHADERDQSPTLGRWMQPDPNPAGQYNDGMNLYQMEGSNPIRYTDASGLALSDGWWEATKAIFGMADSEVQAAFDQTNWDRTTGMASTLPGFQPYHVFDPTEKAKGECFAKCWAQKMGDALAGALLGDLPGNAGYLGSLPLNWVSGTVGNDSIFDTDPEDFAGGATGGLGVATRNYGRQVASRSIARSRWHDLGKPDYRNGTSFREWTTMERGRNARLGRMYEKLGKGLAGVALIHELWKCYQNCEKCP